MQDPHLCCHWLLQPTHMPTWGDARSRDGSWSDKDCVAYQNCFARGYGPLLFCFVYHIVCNPVLHTAHTACRMTNVYLVFIRACAAAKPRMQVGWMYLVQGSISSSLQAIRAKHLSFTLFRYTWQSTRQIKTTACLALPA